MIVIIAIQLVVFGGIGLAAQDRYA